MTQKGLTRKERQRHEGRPVRETVRRKEIHIHCRGWVHRDTKMPGNVDPSSRRGGGARGKQGGSRKEYAWPPMLRHLAQPGAQHLSSGSATPQSRAQHSQTQLEHPSKAGNLQKVGVPRMHSPGALRDRGLRYGRETAGN